MDLGQVQRLVDSLYGSTSPQVAKEAQEQLQIFQRQPYAWEIASQLLSSSSDHARFFGAHTFQIKITRDWNTLPEDRIEWLRNELLTWLVRLSTGPLYITTKLCLSIITYAFNTIPNHWQNFVSETTNALSAGAQTYAIPIQNLHMCLLEFLTLVPEEVSNAEMLGSTRAKIIQELKNSLPLVLSTLSSTLNVGDASIDIQQKAMTCFQAWIQYGIDFEDAYPLLQRCMTLLENEDLFSSAVNVLVEAIPHSSWAKYTTLRNDLLMCFSTDWTRSKFLTCVHDEDEEAAQSLARLFTVYGETYTDFIAQQLADPKIAQLMDMVLQLTNFPGQYPVDQEVSEIPLNFWYVFEETLFDEGIVPVRNGSSLPVVAEDETSAVRTQEQMAWHRQCGEAALAIYRQLVSILKEKAVFPDDAVWESWPKDIKDKYRICRRDLGDTLMYPYYVLRDDMIAILLDHATVVLNQWTDPGQAARELEAILFSIKSISEEIAAEENVHIPRLLGPDIFGRLPTEGNFRMQNTVLLLLGSLSEWLKVHPTFLPAIMNYIVPCFSVSKLAPSAAKAFSNMCDTCRESLVGDLDSLMHVYGAMARSSIPGPIMRSVVESVADVIQVLPPDQAMAPLMTLTGDILQGLAKALDSARNDPSRAEESIITQIGNLCACCRGIQSPSDDYQSISARNSVYDAFARGELTALYTNMEGFTQFTQAIQSSVHQTAHLCSSNEHIMKLLCHFLELAIRATSPLLTLPFQDVVELIVASYRNAPFACWLQVARVVMTAYGGQESCLDGLRNMLGALTGKTFEFINKPEDMEQFPDVVDDYFELLSTTIRRCPPVFYQLPQDMIDTIFRFTIAGMGIQERLAMKAALSFMVDFISQDTEGTPLAEVVNTMMMNMGLSIMEQLIAGIGGRVPRSLAGPLIDVLYKMTNRYMEACRQWLQTLLGFEGFPSTLATSADKEAFIKGIIGCRSMKRFKQVAYEFSIKCRGLENTAYGTAL